MFSTTTMIIELLVPGVLAASGLAWLAAGISGQSLIALIGDAKPAVAGAIGVVFMAYSYLLGTLLNNVLHRYMGTDIRLFGRIVLQGANNKMAARAYEHFEQWTPKQIDTYAFRYLGLPRDYLSAAGKDHHEVGVRVVEMVSRIVPFTLAHGADLDENRKRYLGLARLFRTAAAGQFLLTIAAAVAPEFTTGRARWTVVAVLLTFLILTVSRTRGTVMMQYRSALLNFCTLAERQLREEQGSAITLAVE